MRAAITTSIDQPHSQPRATKPASTASSPTGELRGGGITAGGGPPQAPPSSGGVGAPDVRRRLGVGAPLRRSLVGAGGSGARDGLAGGPATGPPAAAPFS